MELNALTAISPLDGRYRKKVAALAPYLSEFALIKYRILVEVEYFVALQATGLKPLTGLSEADIQWLRALYEQADLTAAERIKTIERTTNHDVKAVEYYIKEQIDASDRDTLKSSKEFIHFGLTSQDINNTATPMMLRDAVAAVYLPGIAEIHQQLSTFAEEWRELPMLARTHGQPASPTGLGKEIAVFAKRLEVQLTELKSLSYPGKFGGATGNLNAHYVAYPDFDWQTFAGDFVEKTLGLSRSYPTTQIEHYDGLARLFDCLKRINTILIDLCQDIWIYISQEYFRQKTKKGEIGSSAMPHKVNPIDFENAEGNCGLSTALLEYLSRKLPVSRLQRDLTDSTVLRNLGPALGYACLAHQSVLKGLSKLLVNPDALQADLDANWAVVAEAIQTVLRREAYPNPYETLLALTRGKSGINETSIREFIETLDVSEEIKAELRTIRPENFVGDAMRNLD
ncbi:MAG: adenylosuccinate lyase [Bacteroidota bacterium]